VLVRRDNREKLTVSLDKLESVIPELLAKLTSALYKKAAENRARRTYTETVLDNFIDTAKNKSGYIRAMWCGDEECELKLKELADVTSRCIPFDEEAVSEKCICCGRDAKALVYWGKAY
jgi:prolyl-tRNA synthetase